MSCGSADLCRHGAIFGGSCWRPLVHALLGGRRRVAIERDGTDVPANECLPLAAVAETDDRTTTRDLFEEPFDIRLDGMVHAPDRPGLGFTLRADAPERFRYVDGPAFEF
jgi:hypothetical protein